MTTLAPAPVSERSGTRYVSDFKRLTQLVDAKGLMKRTYGYYIAAYAAAAGAIAAVVFVMTLLGDTWWQLLPAAALGVIFAQLGFLGHEASHRQVFRSAGRNAWLGRITSNLLVGLSYGWWMSKHSRHHQAPNELGKDPDIVNAVVSFTNEATAERRGFRSWFARRQGLFFMPLLFLQGLELHVASIRRMIDPQPLKYRWVEIVFLAVRLISFIAILFVVFPPGLAAAFLGVQVAVFGFLLGGAFAPNHIGMPIVPRGTSIDFVRRQVLMSRDVSGGPVVRFFMGGLDTQIEHHLFPGMPRPHLRRAQLIVRDYCRENGIRYTETSLWGAYRSVLGHINRVGLAGRDAFTCPLSQQLRA